MRLVKGAPRELVNIWKEWVEAEDRFRKSDHNRADLERYARSQGFASWNAMEDRNVLLRSMLDRLLHWDGMDDIWKALSAETSLPGNSPELWIYQRMERTVDSWFMTTPLSKADRKKALQEISETALNLAGQLRRFEVGASQLSDLRVLMGDERDDAARRFLHPEIVSAMGERPGLAKYVVAQELVPPLSELLVRLADSAGNWSGGPPVTKMGSSTAFRTFFIRRMLLDVFMILKGYTDEFAASFFCVALDDLDVTKDTVRWARRNIIKELSA